MTAKDIQLKRCYHANAKEWVVDEKGFHAKSTWEPSPADKKVVHNADDDGSSGNAPKKETSSPFGKVVLHGEVELDGGQEGFVFNKKFKARMKENRRKTSLKRRLERYCGNLTP